MRRTITGSLIRGIAHIVMLTAKEKEEQEKEEDYGTPVAPV
jgi:hypothetical protein|tara:strand:- start:353 stop:475 length:123 start_codon:yes stop_codon:yes gene_type:complete